MSADFVHNVIDLYDRNALAWVKLRGRALVEQFWLDAFLSTLPQGAADLIDIGCGSGEPIARYLIQKGYRITGVDGASTLVELAKAEFPDHRWLTSDMRRLPNLGRFHGLVAWHSFFHLMPEDQRSMFTTFGRLALPGAGLLFTSGTTHGEVIGTFEGQPLYHGSSDSSEYGKLLQSNGFEVIRHVEHDPVCGGATIWLAKKVL